MYSLKRPRVSFTQPSPSSASPVSGASGAAAGAAGSDDDDDLSTRAAGFATAGAGCFLTLGASTFSS